MHESRLVADLMAAADRHLADPSRITGLTFQIGALSVVTPDALRHGVTESARARWGSEPDITIHQSPDPSATNALGVMLVSLRVED